MNATFAPRLLVIVGSLASAALAAYLLDLFRRTAGFERTAAVSREVLWIVAATCAVGVASAAGAIAMGRVWRRGAVAVLVLALALSSSYVALFVAEKFGPVPAKFEGTVPTADGPDARGALRGRVCERPPSARSTETEAIDGVGRAITPRHEGLITRRARG
jgi:hypothetical protein